MNFITNNQKNFQTNSSTHNINTQNKHHLHRPNANLSCFQNSTFYAGIKIFNSFTTQSDNSQEWQGKIESSLKTILKCALFLLCRWIFIRTVTYNTGHFIMSSMITNIYNKKTKGPALMELFTATGKLKKFFLTTTDVQCAHQKKCFQFSCGFEQFH